MLPHMRKTFSVQAVEARTGRTLEDILRELYVERGYNHTEIGKALGVSRELVRQWINEAGLRDQRPPAGELVA